MPDGRDDWRKGGVFDPESPFRKWWRSLFEPRPLPYWVYAPVATARVTAPEPPFRPSVEPVSPRRWPFRGFALWPEEKVSPPMARPEQREQLVRQILVDAAALGLDAIEIQNQLTRMLEERGILVPLGKSPLDVAPVDVLGQIAVSLRQQAGGLPYDVESRAARRRLARAVTVGAVTPEEAWGRVHLGSDGNGDWRSVLAVALR